MNNTTQWMNIWLDYNIDYSLGYNSLDRIWYLKVF